MRQTKNDILRPSDILTALGLLTRLPIPQMAHPAPTSRGPDAAWAYPIAGAVVAGIACALCAAMLWLGLPLPLSAALFVAIQMILTGAMHEDGLADAADGLWGGWTPARRLEIMKDSHIGTYGTLALTLITLLRWQAHILVLPHSPLAAPIAVAMLSRAPMVILMAALPNARSTGLSQSVGRPAARTGGIAIATAVVATLLATGLAATCLLAALTALATLACGQIARAKIGGQTGDILGATQQICEITALAALATLLG